mmetsp:Transcript_6884/g.22724  ORF Transcript_6884/g.22724 Transcript_6884/m.22724 type:complete len:208 (+) Transcript_6884:485-1108(+)
MSTGTSSRWGRSSSVEVHRPLRAPIGEASLRCVGSSVSPATATAPDSCDGYVPATVPQVLLATAAIFCALRALAFRLFFAFLDNSGRETSLSVATQLPLPPHTCAGEAAEDRSDPHRCEKSAAGSGHASSPPTFLAAASKCGAISGGESDCDSKKLARAAASWEVLSQSAKGEHVAGDSSGTRGSVRSVDAVAVSASVNSVSASSAP